MGQVIFATVFFAALLQSCGGPKVQVTTTKDGQKQIHSEYCEIQRDQRFPLLKSRLPHLTDDELRAAIKQAETFAKLCP